MDSNMIRGFEIGLNELLAFVDWNLDPNILKIEPYLYIKRSDRLPSRDSFFIFSFNIKYDLAFSYDNILTEHTGSDIILSSWCAQYHVRCLPIYVNRLLLIGSSNLTLLDMCIPTIPH